jgi:hypothetical protein
MKWEYLFVEKFEGGVNNSNSEWFSSLGPFTFDELGAMGWELVSIDWQDDFACFKRQLQDETVIRTVKDALEGYFGGKIG